VKILIAGLGSIGRRHLRNLVSLGERDITLFRTHQSTLPDDELSGFPVVNDLQSALDHRPEAVIISNPTSLHLDVAIPAAEAGCHLFLEKPISHNLEKLDQLNMIVRRSNIKVLVGYQYRFHPGLITVQRLLSEEVIGRPISFYAHWGEYLPNWHPWEDYRKGYSARADLGGGVILTLSHPLDYLSWLLGRVHSLWAFAESLGDLEINVEDTAEIGIKFTSGAIGSVHLDYNQRPPTHYLEIVGTEGTIRWDNSDGAVWLYSIKDSSHARDNIEWKQFPAPPNFERNDMFLAEMRHFLAMIREGVKPMCSLEEGYQVLLLALAAIQSASKNELIIL